MRLAGVGEIGDDDSEEAGRPAGEAPGGRVRTVARVSSGVVERTPPAPENTRETVAVETPAALATWRIVAPGDRRLRCPVRFGPAAESAPIAASILARVPLDVNVYI